MASSNGISLCHLPLWFQFQVTCHWSSSAQSFLVLDSTGQMNTFFCVTTLIGSRDFTFCCQSSKLLLATANSHSWLRVLKDILLLPPNLVSYTSNVTATCDILGFAKFVNCLMILGVMQSVRCHEPEQMAGLYLSELNVVLPVRGNT